MGVERQRTGLKLGSGSEPALELPWWKRGNLGTSPDRKVVDGTSFGLLEIKCPAKNSCQDCPYLQRQADGGYKLKETHVYYYQIIGQLGLTGMPWCDFFVMCAEDYHLQRIHLDVEKWGEMKDKLDLFFFDYFLPSCNQ